MTRASKSTDAHDAATPVAVALALTFAAIALPAGVAADGAFDGVWNGTAVASTGGGRCGVNWTLTATVRGDEITGTARRGPEQFALNGEVGADGALKWNVFGPGASADGRGRIEGDSASGDWDDRTGADCDGDFTLTRER